MSRYAYRMIRSNDAVNHLRPCERVVQVHGPAGFPVGFYGDIITTYAERVVPFHSRIATRRRTP